MMALYAMPGACRRPRYQPDFRLPTDSSSPFLRQASVAHAAAQSPMTSIRTRAHIRQTPMRNRCCGAVQRVARLSAPTRRDTPPDEAIAIRHAGTQTRSLPRQRAAAATPAGVVDAAAVKMLARGSTPPRRHAQRLCRWLPPHAQARRRRRPPWQAAPRACSGVLRRYDRRQKNKTPAPPIASCRGWCSFFFIFFISFFIFFITRQNDAAADCRACAITRRSAASRYAP